MRYNININNVKAKEWGLNIQQAYLFVFFYELPSWAKPLTIENKTYYFASKNKAIEEMPLLTDKKDTMYRYYKQIEEKGLIEIIKTNGQDYVRLTQKGKEWNCQSEQSDKNPSKVGKLSELGSDNYPTYNNTINNNNTSIIKERVPKKRSIFKKPTIEDIFNYLTEEKNKEKSFAKKESEKMYNYYESKGWLVGKTKMKKWKAASTNWINRAENEFKTKTNGESKERKFGRQTEADIRSNLSGWEKL